MGTQGQKHFSSELAINHICQSQTGLIESVAEVVGTLHICLMRRLIVQQYYWSLRGQYPIMSNCPPINIWTLKRAVWPPGSLFAQAALYFDRLDGNGMMRQNFKQHFCESRLRNCARPASSQQMDFGSTQFFATFSPALCTPPICLSLEFFPNVLLFYLGLFRQQSFNSSRVRSHPNAFSGKHSL